MANTDAPRGLRPWNAVGGGSPRLSKYSAGTTTNILRGEVVALATNGRLHTIATTTGSANIIGVAANAIIVTQGTNGTSPADIYVYDDPYQEFTIQDDGAGATPAQASLGATYPLVLTAGSTVTGQGGMELDISAPGTATTDPLLAVRYLTGGPLEIAKFATFVVRLNRHILKSGSAGI